MGWQGYIEHIGRVKLFVSIYTYIDGGMRGRGNDARVRGMLVVRQGFIHVTMSS